MSNSSEEVQPMQLSATARKQAEALAREMLNDQRQIAPVQMPGGGTLCYVARDEAALQAPFEIDVDGNTFYVGSHTAQKSS